MGVLVTKDCCNRTTTRTPYGNMGSVDTESICFCCSNLPDIGSPGCGCSNALVAEIAEELQQRKEKRGNIAQMKQQENIIIEILNLDAKTEVMMRQKKLPYPPSPQLVSELFTTKGNA